MKIVNFKKRKGISIVFVIMITGVILAIALGISSISAQQMKTMSEIGFSFISFYAADSGAERQIYDLYRGTYSELTHVDLLNDSFFSVKVKCSQEQEDLNPANCSIPGSTIGNEDCHASNYCIESVGTYKEIKRALELKY